MIITEYVFFRVCFKGDRLKQSDSFRASVVIGNWELGIGHRASAKQVIGHWALGQQGIENW
ncbi:MULTISPECIES: hypothetical protein [unclassified Microcoleus]|uniref:hypothetical protein n=1 Tax=unclassified Microcoleus TaxID=2642155 RepID=UPI002FCF4F25